MDQNGTPLLVAEGVTKIYRTGELSVLALDHLDVTVRGGELVAVMGPSGSGKTTLLNCLSGLDDIDDGRVLVGGRDLFAMSDAERTEHRARSMGFVFQSYNLIPVFTAVENVELPLLLVGTPEREARMHALEMLDRVGIAHRAGHRPNEMSGGEQQRVAIARALVARPAIVWADEPTGNLTPPWPTRSWPCSTGSTPKTGRQSCSSRTIRRSAPRRVGSFACATGSWQATRRSGQ